MARLKILKMCLTESHWKGNISWSPKEIRVKYYLWTESYGQRFQFLTDSNSQRLYQQFGGIQPSLVHLAFLEKLVLQSVVLLTDQLLPFLVLGIIFCEGAGIE